MVVWAVGIAPVVPGRAVGPGLHALPAPGVDRYLRDSEVVQVASTDDAMQCFTVATVPTDRWYTLGSSTLDLIMETAITVDPGLQQAQVNLRIVQDLLRAGVSVFYPRVAGSVDVSRQAAVPARLGQAGVPSLFTLWTFDVSISYTIDPFGGNRCAAEVLTMRAEGQRYAVAAAHLASAGNLVSAMIAHAAYRTQVGTTYSLIAVVREQMEIVHAQIEAGVVVHTSELSLTMQLASLEVLLPPLEQKRDQATHLWVVLTGRFPFEADVVDVALDGLQLPADPPSLAPFELVRQRPDVLATQVYLRQVSVEVGAAMVAMLPNLILSIGYTQVNGRSAGLLGVKAGIRSVGMNLVTPLSEDGTLYLRCSASRQVLQAADAGYRRVVLALFEQVADVLRVLEHDAVQLDTQLHAQAVAGATLDEANADCYTGVVGYLRVSSADQRYQQAVLGTQQVRAQRL